MVSNPNSSISREELLDLVYPVGSVYISFNNTSPKDFLGGTWTQLQDRFLLAASDTYPAGFSGGEATHALTQKEMPSHTHSGISTRWSVQSGSGPTCGAIGGSNFLVNNSGSWTTNSAGGGQAHNNMPPYIGVYMWRRTA